LEKGAKRAIKLQVGGAFHSPLMEPARKELEEAIATTKFNVPQCPIYQDVDAKPYTNPEQIKANLIAQLTSPVRWSQIVKNMAADGFTQFIEVGPGTVLQGLITKTVSDVEAKSAEL
jgi:[acyl-carrier-protein] S-malonyltransferase